MPAATAKKPTPKPTNQSVADQDKVAKANLLRNQTRAAGIGKVGYIIRSPAYGQILDRPLGRVVLQIHRHLIVTKKETNKNLKNEEGYKGMTDAEFETYPGSVLVGLDGEWFTTDPIVAAYVKSEYVPKGYTIQSTDENMDPSIQRTAEHMRARAIIDGGISPEEYDGVDLEFVEEVHPDTPQIMA